MKVLVTGGTGFIGSALSNRLASQPGFTVCVSVRRRAASVAENRMMHVAELAAGTDSSEALAGVDVVVHTAARVHVMRERVADPLTEYRAVNVAGSLNLARQAARARVRRFVFLSSIKVNGERTSSRCSFSADDVPAPEDPYGVSKYEAEEGLKRISSAAGMELVIVRPPLVYGPGVRANFDTMMRLLAQGIPLPLGAVTDNRRSFVALDNLLDMIRACLTEPAAANQTFLVSDGEDLSTANLLVRMGEALNRPARLFNMPTGVLSLGAMLFNKKYIYERLCGSLALDIDKTKDLLNWRPPIGVDEGLRRAAAGLGQEQGVCKPEF